MAIQKINLGTEPLGEGGDTYRSANTKINENFSNKGHAASRLVGENAGNVLEFGSFGIGNPSTMTRTQAKEKLATSIGNFALVQGVEGDTEGGALGSGFIMSLPWVGGITTDIAKQLYFGAYTSEFMFRQRPTLKAPYSSWQTVYHTENTNIGTNGVLSAKSPVTHLYHNRLEHTGDEKELQPIEFVKQGVGDYLIKNTTGLAQEGWYIVIPQDANGNPLIAVEYDDRDGDINVRTYKRKFDYEQSKVVADHDNPMDIPETRWIDLRFNDDPSLYDEEHPYVPEPEEEPVVDEVVVPEEEEPAKESK